MSNISDFVINDGVLIGYTGNDEAVVIPEGVIEIEERRSNDGVFFKNDRIRSVSFPKSLKKIGAFAFKQCTSLEKVEFHSTPELKGYIFEGCTALQEVVLPDGTRRIPSSLFAGCATLSKVTIPDTVVSIDRYAFQNCASLKRLELPPQIDTASIKYLFDRGGDNLQIEELVLPENNPHAKLENGLLLSKDGTVVHKCIAHQFEAIKIPDGVRKIEPTAFAYCQGEHLTIPKTVTEMTDAFGLMANVDTMVFEEGFEVLPARALNCGVSQLVLPKSLKLIQTSAFKGIRNLKTLKLYDTYRYEQPKRYQNDEIFVFSAFHNDPSFDPVERIEVYNTSDDLLIAVGLPCGKEAKGDLEYVHTVLHNYITGWNCYTKTFEKPMDPSALEVWNGDGFWYGFKKPESKDRFVYGILPFLNSIAQTSAATYLEHAQKRKKQLMKMAVEHESVDVLSTMKANGLLTDADRKTMQKLAQEQGKIALLHQLQNAL